MLLFCLPVRSQTGVYLTYEDYKSKNQILYNDIGVTGNKIVCKGKDNESVKYAVRDIWGFKLDYQLFRCQGSKFYYVSFYGKVIMYANGKENFNGMKGNFSYRANHFSTYYLSDGLGEDIYSQHDFRKFKEDYPQHQRLYECMGRSITYNKFKDCLSSYNASK